MQIYRTKGKMDRRALLHFLEPTRAQSAQTRCQSTEQVLTNGQDGPRLCSLIAISEENITVRHSRRRILILIILLEEEIRQTTAEISSNHNKSYSTTSTVVSLPVSQRSPARLGRTGQQTAAMPGSWQPTPGVLQRAEMSVSRAGEGE